MLAGGVAGLMAGPVGAGVWMRSSCINPGGSAASSEGWSSQTAGVGAGSANSVLCTPSSAMFATLSADAPVPVGGHETLVYTPPDGSRLTGGVIGVDLLADGGGRDASGVAAVYTPAFSYDGSNVVWQCAAGLGPCSNSSDAHHYVGRLTLPSGRGGQLYVSASCGGHPGAVCDAGGSQGAWSRVLVSYANLLLSSSVVPTADDFRGSLLAAGAHGTAALSFTARAGGPGVYKVGVAVDGRSVYDATPNTNQGRCVPVGSDAASGALVFAYQQPCLLSHRVDLLVRTTGLRDGEHELRVVVTDAALNAQTVLRQTVTTNNRTTTSSLLTSDPPPGLRPTDPIAAAADVTVELDAPTRARVEGVRRIWKGSALTLSGTVKTATGLPGTGVAVTLFAHNAVDREPRVLARTTSDASGRWMLRAPRGPSRTLTIAAGAQPDPTSEHALNVRQTVRPGVSLRVQALGKGRLRFIGRLRIQPLGSPRPVVVIQTLNRHRKWKDLGTGIRVSSEGEYAVTYDGGPDVIGGSYVFRTIAPATKLFSTGVSTIRRALVR